LQGRHKHRKFRRGPADFRRTAWAQPYPPRLSNWTHGRPTRYLRSAGTGDRPITVEAIALSVKIQPGEFSLYSPRGSLLHAGWTPCALPAIRRYRASPGSAVSRHSGGVDCFDGGLDPCVGRGDRVSAMRRDSRSPEYALPHQFSVSSPGGCRLCPAFTAHHRRAKITTSALNLERKECL
jgi:hypothetical protein